MIFSRTPTRRPLANDLDAGHCWAPWFTVVACCLLLACACGSFGDESPTDHNQEIRATLNLGGTGEISFQEIEYWARRSFKVGDSLVDVEKEIDNLGIRNVAWFQSSMDEHRDVFLCEILLEKRGLIFRKQSGIAVVLSIETNGRIEKVDLVQFSLRK